MSHSHPTPRSRHGSAALRQALPSNATRWSAVWLRNCKVWRKAAWASAFANLADPMIYLFALGYGLGLMIGHVGGVSYIAFLAAGTTASSVMITASFEGMYSVFARMREQRTWEAIMFAPLTLGDIIAGEVAWGASKALLSGAAIMLVASLLGYAHGMQMLLALPAIVLGGLAFTSLAMVATALAPGYDFFLFYQTLLLTPMMMLSGVFFPIDSLPTGIRVLSECLPLSHLVALVSAAMLDRPVAVLPHVLVLVGYLLVGLSVSAILFKRRLMR